MTNDHYGKVQTRILEPMRVACHKAVSATPENDAINAMRKWLTEQKLGNVSGIRMFGFDAEVTPEQQKRGMRGYEVWASVPKGIDSSGNVKVRDFAGGVFAVMRITDPFSNPFEVIPAGWRRLVGWAKSSDEYEIVDGPCLEELVQSGGQDYLDVYLPVAAKKKSK